MRLFAVLMLIALACSACGGSSFEPAVSFGADNTTCDSVEVAGDAEDRQPIQDAVGCLLDELDAGNPVVVDFSIGTVEGDRVYMRYAFDGEASLIVSGDRLDEFGSVVSLLRFVRSSSQTQSRCPTASSAWPLDMTALLRPAK